MPSENHRPTQEDVAREAGVSRAVVSYVINNRSGGKVRISEPTRRRVLEVVQRLGYQPNVNARSLRTRRSQLIAVMVPDLTNPFYPLMIRGAQAVAQRAAYDILVYDCDDQPARERPFTTAFVDSTLTVRYARQYQLAVRLEGPVPGVAPGTVRFSPPAADDGWFAPGTAVDVLAEPLTGFAFERWEGAAAGGANPVRVLMDTARALRGFFRQTFAARPAGPVTIAGADSVELVLQAENGTPPFLWTLQAGRLPAGRDRTLARAPPPPISSYRDPARRLCISSAFDRSYGSVQRELLKGT